MTGVWIKVWGRVYVRRFPGSKELVRSCIWCCQWVGTFKRWGPLGYSPNGRSRVWLLPCALQLSQAPATWVTSTIEVIQQGALARADVTVRDFQSHELHAPLFCISEVQVFWCGNKTRLIETVGIYLLAFGRCHEAFFFHSIILSIHQTQRGLGQCWDLALNKQTHLYLTVNAGQFSTPSKSPD